MVADRVVLNSRIQGNALIERCLHIVDVGQDYSRNLLALIFGDLNGY